MFHYMELSILSLKECKSEQIWKISGMLWFVCRTNIFWSKISECTLKLVSIKPSCATTNLSYTFCVMWGKKSLEMPAILYLKSREYKLKNSFKVCHGFITVFNKDLCYFQGATSGSIGSPGDQCIRPGGAPWGAQSGRTCHHGTLHRGVHLHTGLPALLETTADFLKGSSLRGEYFWNS